MVDCVLITSTTGKILPLSVYPYLGIGYLASTLMRQGLQVKIYDVDAELLTHKEIMARLQKDRPHIIGFSILSRSLPFFYTLVPQIKKVLPEAIIIGGGPHVSSDPGIVSELGIPYGIRGDAEESFPLLVQQLLSGNPPAAELPGLVAHTPDLRICNNAVTTETFDPLLDPAYGLYKMDAYCDIVYPGVRSFTMETSRGCVYNCNFCSNHSKSKVRFYPMETVERQLDALVHEHQVRWIAFVDDLFTYDKERVIQISESIIRNKLNIKWSCLTRVDKLDSEMLAVMKRSGLENVIFGVESGSEKIRAVDNKRIKNDQYVQAIKLCNAHGVKTLNTFIFGHPGETRKDMTRTIFYSVELKSRLTHYQLMSPLPDSPLFNQGVRESKFEQDAWSLHMKGLRDEPFYFPDGISMKTVRIMHLMAYVLYFFLPTKFFRMSFSLLKLLRYKWKRNKKLFLIN